MRSLLLLFNAHAPEDTQHNQNANCGHVQNKVSMRLVMGVQMLEHAMRSDETFSLGRRNNEMICFISFHNSLCQGLTEHRLTTGPPI